ncbi:MAG: DUF6520 family protein [Chitinophagaceae bacterium]
MTKKFVLPVFAVIAALAIVFGMSAFQIDKKVVEEPVLDYYFEFNPLLTPSEGNVEAPGSWSQVSNAGTCNQSLTRPCRIKVPASATDDNGPGNPRTLKSTASIVAAHSTGGMYYVQEDGDITEAYNRSN